MKRRRRLLKFASSCHLRSNWKPSVSLGPEDVLFLALESYLPVRKVGKEEAMLLLLILLILVLAVAPAWPYSRGWGYYPSGGLGTILLILIILMLLGMVHF